MTLAQDHPSRPRPGALAGHTYGLPIVRELPQPAADPAGRRHLVDGPGKLAETILDRRRGGNVSVWSSDPWSARGRKRSRPRGSVRFLRNGGVPSVGSVRRAGGFEEGGMEPRVDGVLRPAVVVCGRSAHEPCGRSTSPLTTASAARPRSPSEAIGHTTRSRQTASSWRIAWRAASALPVSTLEPERTEDHDPDVAVSSSRASGMAQSMLRSLPSRSAT